MNRLVGHPRFGPRPFALPEFGRTRCRLRGKRLGAALYGRFAQFL
jgi:hypothetical protein